MSEFLVQLEQRQEAAEAMERGESIASLQEGRYWGDVYGDAGAGPCGISDFWMYATQNNTPYAHLFCLRKNGREFSGPAGVRS